MVELVEQSGVDGRQLLHGEVDVVEAVPQAVQEELGEAAGDGGCVAGARQLRQLQPLAAQALLCAEVDVVGQGAQAADEVHVGHAESARVVVLLPDTQEGAEFCADSRLLKNFAYGCGTFQIRQI